MDTKAVDPGAAIQGLVNILPALVADLFLQLATKGVMTPLEAGEAMRGAADLAESIRTPEPFIGFALARAMREYAAALDRSTPGEPPVLTLICGGRDETPATQES